MTHNAQNRTTLDLGCVKLQQLWFEPPLAMSVTEKIENSNISSPVTKGSETLNLNNLSKERSNLVKIPLHSTYEECLLYVTPTMFVNLSKK